jgi:hypothetical protein
MTFMLVRKVGEFLLVTTKNAEIAKQISALKASSKED